MSYQIGSKHILVNRFDGSRKVFEWTENGWSTPGTGYATKAAIMSVLGWKYEGPES